MSDRHSTTPADAAKPPKPSKPYPEFPLYAHAAGVWAKKIRGKLYYFGPWTDADGALQKYQEQKEALHAGRKPREAAAGADVKELCNRFLHHKRSRVDEGLLTQRTWDEYKAACDQLVTAFGKRRLLADLDPDDFAALRTKLAKRFGPVRLGNEIQRVRSGFKVALEAGLIDRTMRFGPDFARPGRKLFD